MWRQLSTDQHHVHVPHPRHNGHIRHHTGAGSQRARGPGAHRSKLEKQQDQETFHLCQEWLDFEELLTYLEFPSVIADKSCI